MASLLRLAVFVLLALGAAAQDLSAVRVGQWVELKGKLDEQGRFVVSSLEAQAPSDAEELLGEVESIDAAAQNFRLLGRTIWIDERTRFEQTSFAKLAGTRVRAQLRWRSNGRLEARQVYARGAGRDRITGRLDEFRSQPDGSRSGRVLGFEVLFPITTALDHPEALAGLALAPEKMRASPGGPPVERDLEDSIPASIRLGTNLTLGFLFEDKTWEEQNFDLDDAARGDRLRCRTYLRAALHWTPSEEVELMLSPRFEWDARYVEGGADQRVGKLHWNEAFVALHDLPVAGLGLYAGRQLYDDEREWIYKQNLDALRLHWSGGGLSADLSASRIFDDGDDFDLHSENRIGYFATTDEKHHIAFWFVDRRDDREPRNYPFHYGLRALGEFLPRTNCWFELSGLRGYDNDLNLRGWGYDAGLTWKPRALAPFYFGIGHAFGSGDDRSTTTSDEGFRQTGLQKNNGKFGGVANFRYYGEVLDPELSNLSITTIDIGFRPWSRVSVDLVWHDYAEVALADSLRNTNLRMQPDGQHRWLGQETDVVIGFRTHPSWDLNLIFGVFRPGSAFPDADAASEASLQFRCRF